MGLWLNLTAGVLSSLIAVALVEFYRRIRSELVHRSIRQVIPNCSGRTVIYTPVFPGSETLERSGLLAGRDAQALAMVYSLCSRVRLSTGVLSSRVDHSNSLLPGWQSSGLICIGGSVANSVTDFVLRRAAMGVSVAPDPESEVHKDTWQLQVGSEAFADDRGQAYGFILRLTEQDSNMEGGCLLIWGNFARGTSGAARYLQLHADRFKRRYGLGSYLLVLSCPRNVKTDVAPAQVRHIPLPAPPF